MLPNHQLVDTHAHLCDSVFDPDRTEVLERARSAGVRTIIIVGEDLADVRRNFELAEKFSMLRPAAGLYPAHLDLEAAKKMRAVIRRERNTLVGIGEVGLDFWVVKEESAKELQKEIFRGFIELSKELGLPLNIHSRSAGRHAVAMLLESGAEKVQLHAFDGKASTALPAVEAGFFFSVPPSVMRSRQKQKLVKQLPLTSLLIESDSPVLGPSPRERNEPANITTSIKAIAELKNVSEKEVVEAVVENTHRLYGNLQ